MTETWKKCIMGSTKYVFNIIDIIDIFWAPNHIRMISEQSCATEDWSNDCWKFK